MRRMQHLRTTVSAAVVGAAAFGLAGAADIVVAARAEAPSEAAGAAPAEAADVAAPAGGSEGSARTLRQTPFQHC